MEPRLKERDSKWGHSSRVKFLPPLWAEVNPDDLSFNFSDALVFTSPSLPPSCTRPFYSRASCLIVHPSGRPPEEEEKETSGDTFKSALLKRGKDVLQQVVNSLDLLQWSEQDNPLTDGSLTKPMASINQKYPLVMFTLQIQ